MFRDCTQPELTIKQEWTAAFCNNMEVPDHVNHVWCFEADEDGVEKLLFGLLTKKCFFLQAYVRSSFPAVFFSRSFQDLNILSSV